MNNMQFSANAVWNCPGCISLCPASVAAFKKMFIVMLLLRCLVTSTCGWHDTINGKGGTEANSSDSHSIYRLYMSTTVLYKDTEG